MVVIVVMVVIVFVVVEVAVVMLIGVVVVLKCLCFYRILLLNSKKFQTFDVLYSYFCKQLPPHFIDSAKK